jgi:hypothetical protein
VLVTRISTEHFADNDCHVKFQAKAAFHVDFGTRGEHFEVLP